MNDYFCVMPFYGGEYSFSKKFTPCCLLPEDADISKIQDDMLNGIKPEACKKCWDLESKGLTSDRQLKNSAFDYYANKDIRYIEEDCKSKKNSQQIIKLYTSNLCNLTCVTCSEVHSSKWASLKGIPIVKNSIENNVLDNIDWVNLKMLSFVGGEPFYERKNFSILENLISVGNTSCYVDLVTNASSKLTEEKEQILRQFKNLNICVSIDGIGKTFEYIRYPLKWDDLLENIEQYKRICPALSVSFTISNLNILHYDETIEWFKRNNLNFNHNIVYFPKHFNIDVLPTQIKKNLNLVQRPKEFDAEMFQKFINVVDYQDKIKNIQIKDYLPDIWEIISEFRKNVLPK